MFEADVVTCDTLAKVEKLLLSCEEHPCSLFFSHFWDEAMKVGDCLYGIVDDDFCSLSPLGAPGNGSTSVCICSSCVLGLSW